MVNRDEVQTSGKRGKLSIVCTKGTESELYQIMKDFNVSSTIKPSMSGVVVEVDTDRQDPDPDVIAWNKQKLSEILQQPNQVKASDWKPSNKFDPLRHEGMPYTISRPDPKLPRRKVEEPDLICFADVERKDVDWLWNGYIPRGMLTTIQGDPGGGKTYSTTAFAAGITRGTLPPDAQNNISTINPENVLFINGEDSLEHTIAPRLDKAGADSSKVFTLRIDRDPLDFSQIPRIENAIRQVNPILVVFDPIQQFLGAGVDLHRANEVRPVLARIKDLAAEYDFACIFVMHMNKYGGGKAQYRGLGSIDIAAIMRSQLLIGNNRNISGGRLIVPIKNSLGELLPAQGFTIDGEGVHWTGPDYEATEKDVLMEVSAEKGTALNEAIEWLRDTLTEQPVWSTDLEELAESAGIPKRTLVRARTEMRDAWEIVSKKAPGIGKWYWGLNKKNVTFSSENGLDYENE